MEYNRGTFKDFISWLLMVALAVATLLCLILLSRSRFEAPPTPPGPVVFVPVWLSPPTSAGLIFQTIAKTDQQIIWSGAVIWECQQKMVAQNPYTVVLRVEKERLDGFELGLDQSISKKKQGVNVATRTEAQLNGEDFSIVPEDVAARKIVGDHVYQEWRWQVTPKSSGQHRLLIVVSPIVQIKDVLDSHLEGETPFGDPFRDYKDIEVSMNWDRFFRDQFPQWSNIALGTALTLFIGLIGWLIRRFRKSRGSMPANPPDPTPSP